MERSREWHKKISEYIRAKISVKDIVERLHNTTIKEVEKSISENKKYTRWYEESSYPRCEIGAKNDCTFNEEFALNGYPKYEYNSLSEDEKRIYNNQPWINK